MQYNISMNATLAMLVATALLDSILRRVLEVGAADKVPVLIFKSHNSRLQTDALKQHQLQSGAMPVNVKNGPGPGSEL